MNTIQNVEKTNTKSSFSLPHWLERNDDSMTSVRPSVRHNRNSFLLPYRTSKQNNPVLGIGPSSSLKLIRSKSDSISHLCCFGSWKCSRQLMVLSCCGLIPSLYLWLIPRGILLLPSPSDQCVETTEGYYNKKTSSPPRLVATVSGGCQQTNHMNNHNDTKKRASLSTSVVNKNRQKIPFSLYCH